MRQARQPGRRGRLALLVAVAFLGHCGQGLFGRPPEVRETPVGEAASPPAMVWVEDFEVDAPAPEDAGGTPGPAGRILERVREGPADPETRRERLVNEMAEDIVRSLQQAGWPARRTPPGGDPPASGWLVRGVFTTLDTGNALRRGLLGLGAGRDEIEVHVTVDDLAKGAPEPIYRLEASKDGSRGPGAGAMVKLNPYAAAAKSVISRKEPERDVASTARAIADSIVRLAAKAP